MAFSLILGQWSLGQERKILIDFGLTTLSLFGLLVSIFIGIGLVYKEIERRTIFTILAKSIKRRDFVLGKFFGMAGTVFVLIAVMGGVLYGLLAVRGGRPPYTLFIAFILTYFEMLVMVGIALTFSCITTPMISAIMSIMLYIIGHLSSDINLLGPGIDSPVLTLVLKLLYFILPNFERFNINAEVVHGLPMEWGAITLSVGYGVLYVTLLLALSVLFLERREFQ